MAKRASLPPEMRKSVHSIHVPDGTWNKFIKCFPGSAGNSASAQITQWIEKFLNEHGSNTQEAKAFNYEQKVQDKTTALKKELEQQAFLEKGKVEGGRGSISVFEALSNFAMSFINPKPTGLVSIEAIKEARQNLVNYQLTGREAFSRSQRLIYIHYLDYVLKRRTLEKEIEEHLQNNTQTPTLNLKETVVSL